MIMSHCKGNEASNVPSSGSNSQEVEPGAQAVISGAKGEMAQVPSVAQSSPRRTAAAASTVQQCGGARCYCGATGTVQVRTQQRS